MWINLKISGQIQGVKVRRAFRSQYDQTDRGFYHADRPEGQQVVILLAVGPGVPAGILALLQDEHLTTEVYLLKAHKAEEGRKGHMKERRVKVVICS